MMGSIGIRRSYLIKYLNIVSLRFLKILIIPIMIRLCYRDVFKQITELEITLLKIKNKATTPRTMHQGFSS